MDLNIWTISGAAAGATILAQFAKALGLSGMALRLLVIVSAFIIFMVSVLLTASDINVMFVIGVAIAAAQAGLSAVAGYDSGKSGIDYTVTKAE